MDFLSEKVDRFGYAGMSLSPVSLSVLGHSSVELLCCLSRSVRTASVRPWSNRRPFHGNYSKHPHALVVRQPEHVRQAERTDSDTIRRTSGDGPL